MMNALDNYEKLKGELHRIFVEGFDLQEDEFLGTFLSSAKTSNCALGLARKLKEDGNYLFKQEQFDDALEQYGYAGVLLACCDFERDEDRVAFFDLAISILLNTTACLSRKKEYVKVGQLCSVVLDFKPNSVKALFRRAVAAMELGETKWGYWDLLLAMEVEPRNPEVVKKFEEVKCILDKENSAKHAQEITPMGLGVGLSPPKGKKSQCLDMKSFTNQCEDQVMDSNSNKRKGEGELDVSSNIKKEKHDGCAIEDMNVRDRESDTLQEGLKVKEEKVKVGKIGVSDSRNSIQAESMYRFQNRKRPGSSISISKRDYDLLKKGKSVKFFNHKCGTLLTLQVKEPKEDFRKEDDFLSDEVSMSEMKNVNWNGKASNNTRDGGELSAISSKSEDPGSPAFPSKSEQSEFHFSASSMNEERDKLVARVKKKAPQREPKAPFPKKRYSSLCFVGFCRPHAGTKRKLCSLQASMQHPRKKSSNEYWRSVKLDCFPFSSFETCSCSSVCSYGSCDNAPHAMVSDHQNG